MKPTDSDSTEMAEVKHDPEKGKFFIKISGKEAHLVYKKAGEGVLDYMHTFVPPELRGGGIAGKIVKTALEYAREHQFRVIPSCSYVDAFIRRHPEFADMAE